MVTSKIMLNKFLNFRGKPSVIFLIMNKKVKYMKATQLTNSAHINLIKFV